MFARIRKLLIEWKIVESFDSPMRGWITPNGEFHKVEGDSAFQHAEDGKRAASKYGLHIPSDEPRDIVDTLHKNGWSSVGHAGQNYATGENLYKQGHPAQRKLRELMSKHNTEDHFYLSPDDRSYHKVSADHYMKHGALLDADTRQRIKA